MDEIFNRRSGVMTDFTRRDLLIGGDQEVVMAKVIEFYIPKEFRKPLKLATQLQCGKVIEFSLQTKKSA